MRPCAPVVVIHSEDLSLTAMRAKINRLLPLRGLLQTLRIDIPRCAHWSQHGVCITYTRFNRPLGRRGLCRSRAVFALILLPDLHPGELLVEPYDATVVRLARAVYPHAYRCSFMPRATSLSARSVASATSSGPRAMASCRPIGPGTMLDNASMPTL